ncbi:MAG: hypothetical protein ACRD2W_10230 [Acidimicrobiales bacterium]
MSSARTESRISIAATTRARAAIAVVAPTVLVTAFVLHPDVGNPADSGFTAAIAQAVAADKMRWAIAHLAVAIGSGLLILAFLAVRSYLHDAGEDRWSVVGLPFIVMGSTLFALLPAFEFAPLAAAEAGFDLAGIRACQDALRTWFVPILVLGGLTFLVGTLAFAAAVARSGVFSRRMTTVVVIALVAMAAGRLVPLGRALTVGAAMGVVALWPLAQKMGRLSAGDAPAGP